LVCYNAEFYNSVLFNGEIRGGSLSIGAVSGSQNVYNFTVDPYGNISAGYDPVTHQYIFTVDNNGITLRGYATSTEVQTAQSTANSASTAASNAATAASTAQSTADAAQRTANSASTAASTAQGTANTAQKGVTSLNQVTLQKNVTVGDDTVNFTVDQYGHLTCNGATIAGDITANNGTFNGTVNAKGGTFTGTEKIKGTLDIDGSVKFNNSGLIFKEYSCLINDGPVKFIRFRDDINLNLSCLAFLNSIKPFIIRANDRKILLTEGKAGLRVNGYISGTYTTDHTYSFSGDIAEIVFIRENDKFVDDTAGCYFYYGTGCYYIQIEKSSATLYTISADGDIPFCPQELVGSVSTFRFVFCV
jgi:hypothetical protein